MPNAPDYPNIVCELHPGVVAPGYVICYHVLNGSPTAEIERATLERMGSIQCAWCAEQESNPDDFTTACALCAAEYLERRERR